MSERKEIAVFTVEEIKKLHYRIKFFDGSEIRWTLAPGPKDPIDPDKITVEVIAGVLKEAIVRFTTNIGAWNTPENPLCIDPGKETWPPPPKKKISVN